MQSEKMHDTIYLLTCTSKNSSQSIRIILKKLFESRYYDILEYVYSKKSINTYSYKPEKKLETRHDCTPEGNDVTAVDCYGNMLTMELKKRNN